MAAGRPLSEQERYAVRRTLAEIANGAGYAPGMALARRLLAAWTAQWGDGLPGQSRVRVVWRTWRGRFLLPNRAGR